VPGGIWSIAEEMRIMFFRPPPHNFSVGAGPIGIAFDGANINVSKL